MLELLAIASEFFPLVKTGGLADVAGALPAALAAHGVRVTTLIPGYPPVLAKLGKAIEAAAIPGLFGGNARIIAAKSGAADLFALEAPHLFAREGGIYGHADDAFRFAALARAGALLATGLIPSYRADAVHAHDWQAALTAAYLRFGPQPAPPSVLTIHNLAFQGLFPPDLLPSLALPPEAYTPDGVEFWGQIGYLKAGIALADRVTTVSPSYAAEITTPEGGMGLDGVLRSRGADFSGILNGIDTEVWNPATDPAIEANFTAATLEARAANKTALAARFGLNPDAPLFAAVSRLTWQKGLDLLPAAIPTLRAAGATLAVLGSGDAELEAALSEAAAQPGAGLFLGYDESLAHLIYAGADVLLIPSRFEPCGLTQLCAMRYGCLPLVSRVGGLADTVIDANPAALHANAATGFQFNSVSLDQLTRTIDRACALWPNRAAWQRMQKNALAADVSWTASAGAYAALFRELA